MTSTVSPGAGTAVAALAPLGAAPGAMGPVAVEGAPVVGAAPAAGEAPVVEPAAGGGAAPLVGDVPAIVGGLDEAAGVVGASPGVVEGRGDAGVCPYAAPELSPMRDRMKGENRVTFMNGSLETMTYLSSAGPWRAVMARREPAEQHVVCDARVRRPQEALVSSLAVHSCVIESRALPP